MKTKESLEQSLQRIYDYLLQRVAAYRGRKDEVYDIVAMKRWEYNLEVNKVVLEPYVKYIKSSFTEKMKRDMLADPATAPHLEKIEAALDGCDMFGSLTGTSHSFSISLIVRLLTLNALSDEKVGSPIHYRNFPEGCEVVSFLSNLLSDHHAWVSRKFILWGVNAKCDPCETAPFSVRMSTPIEVVTSFEGRWVPDVGFSPNEIEMPELRPAIVEVKLRERYIFGRELIGVGKSAESAPDILTVLKAAIGLMTIEADIQGTFTGTNCFGFSYHYHLHDVVPRYHPFPSGSFDLDCDLANRLVGLCHTLYSKSEELDMEMNAGYQWYNVKYLRDEAARISSTMFILDSFLTKGEKSDRNAVFERWLREVCESDEQAKHMCMRVVDIRNDYAHENRVLNVYKKHSLEEVNEANEVLVKLISLKFTRRIDKILTLDSS